MRLERRHAPIAPGGFACNLVRLGRTSPSGEDARDVLGLEHRRGRRISREIFGFVLNRLQGALLAEAFRLVGEGIVSPQDLDVTLKDGLGLRWSFMGPFETIELNAPGGIADYCARYTGSMKRIASDPATPAVFEADNVARVTAAWGRTPTPDEIARKSAWRDRRLTALLAHKRAQPKS